MTGMDQYNKILKDLNIHKPPFEIGDKVFLITDPDQRVRIITGFVVRKHEVLILMRCGEYETEHSEYEISTDKNVIL